MVITKLGFLMKPKKLQWSKRLHTFALNAVISHFQGQLCKTSGIQIAALGQRLLHALEANWLGNRFQVVIDMHCGGSLRVMQHTHGSNTTIHGSNTTILECSTTILER